MKQLTKGESPKYTSSSYNLIPEKQPSQKVGKKANQTFLQRSIEMANKHTKICSKSLITKETQVKTRMRYHLTPVRMANIENSTNNKCWRKCGGKGNALALVVGV